MPSGKQRSSGHGKRKLDPKSHQTPKRSKHTENISAKHTASATIQVELEQKVTFAVNERCLAFYGPRLYDAKILQVYEEAAPRWRSPVPDSLHGMEEEMGHEAGCITSE